VSAFVGDIPSRLTTADVWRLLRDGFNANEVAYIGGVAIETAEAMIAEARARVPRESPTSAQVAHG
jgi:hypothetical protein